VQGLVGIVVFAVVVVAAAAVVAFAEPCKQCYPVSIKPDTVKQGIFVDNHLHRQAWLILYFILSTHVIQVDPHT